MSLNRQGIHKNIYSLRIIGMALGGLLVSGVLYEQQTGWPQWSFMVLSCLLWPHLAYWHARRAIDPHRAETLNLLVDSAIAGAWVPLMHYSLLPSAVLVLVTTLDKLSSGIRFLWLKSLPGLVGTGLMLALWLRPQPLLDASLLVIVCSLPLLVMHTLAVSVASHRLIRTVARQNKVLEELRRNDTLSGLFAREHWLQLADAAYQRFRASGQPACLMMIDIDHFKTINDRFGHTVGDEVVRAFGLNVRQCLRPTDWAGRYGGDEFAVLCPATQLEDARVIAQRVKEQVGEIRVREVPDLKISCSIGLAAVSERHHDLRAWINDADAVLYQAKHGGRNQVQEMTG
jgi:diguanylate cyclase